MKKILSNYGGTEEVRESGLEVVGSVPWGTHFCQFYQTQKDLLDTLVPYFAAGLQNNEFCVWVTSEFLTKEEAITAMQKSIPNFSKYFKKGQMEIFPYTEWYLKEGKFELERVLKMWLAKHDHGLQAGFAGLRVSGNPFWLDNKKDWDDFAAYEAEINNVIGPYKLLVLCTYSLTKCGANEVIDVVTNHQFALIKRSNDWELIESAEQKKAKEALRQSEERLRNFLAIVGHELKNFITPISLSLDLLEQKKELNGSRKHLSLIRHQTGNMSQLLQDLQDISSLGKSKIELIKKRVDLAVIIQHAVENVKPLFDHAQQELKLSLPEQKIVVKADPLRVEQILTNLLSNASKYSKEKTMIKVTLKQKGDMILIKVKDQGIGISSTALPRIFDLFMQEDQHKKERKLGLGIGLYLSRELARLHGGDLIANSKGKGSGSEFVLTIPLKNLHN